MTENTIIIQTQHTSILFVQLKPIKTFLDVSYQENSKLDIDSLFS